MAIIVERPLYSRITIETTATSGAFSWVDQTSYLTNASYSEGTQEITLGKVGPDTGTFTASFKNMSTVPNSGDYVRIRRTGTSEYAFTGYIQDVSQGIVFSNSTGLSTPVTITTITALDWVGLLSQVQINGIDGRNASNVALDTSHQIEDRIRSLNYQFDNTNSTELIEVNAYANPQPDVSCTNYSGTIADHLDLVVRSTDSYWFANHIIPTDASTGRDKMVSYRKWATNVASGKTFTDAAGSAGNLHYTEINLQSSSANVANIVTINNSGLINRLSNYGSKVGGANQNNNIDINGTRQVFGTVNEEKWTIKNSSSITNYGARISEIETNVDLPVEVDANRIWSSNRIVNPSAEYDDVGYSGAGATNPKVRRRVPSFGAYSGNWAIRSRATLAASVMNILYSGGESDGIEFSENNYASFRAFAARDTTSRSDVRAQARITWIDDSENTISTSVGSVVALTTANTWYNISVVALAPANTVRATVQVLYDRPSSANHSNGDMVWLDALLFQQSTSTAPYITSYYDGDSANTSTYCYSWTGEVGNSQTVPLRNYLNTLGATLTARFSTTSIRVTRIRWNAQEDLTAVSSLTVGKTISLVYKSTTTTYRIVGIDGTVDPDRYMIDYYLAKV